MHAHVSCLGCDEIKTDTMKMVCGHNICRDCLNKYSATEHPKSSVRCDICNIETKVFLMSVSIPNRAICLLLHSVETRLGRKLNVDSEADNKGKVIEASKKSILKPSSVLANSQNHV